MLHLGAGPSLEDLGSSNGTFVNGRRLVAGEKAAVASGADLRGDVKREAEG